MIMWSLYSRRKTTNKGLLRLSKAALLVVAMVSFSAASANEFELSRLAGELRAASAYLAQDLRYSRGFGSVGQRADRLARDATQLVDAIARRRSASYIRSQYKDVSARYSDLEDAFFRASRNYADEQVFNQVSTISGLFDDLSAVYYYSPIYTSRTPVVTLVNPRFGQRQGFLSNGFGGNSDVYFPGFPSSGFLIPGLRNNGGTEMQHPPGVQQGGHRNEREHDPAHRATAVERLRVGEGLQKSGQRIIRQRAKASSAPRRRRQLD
jgi:hypothetical protein